MSDLEKIESMARNTNVQLRTLCTIKHYIPTKEKIDFINRHLTRYWVNEEADKNPILDFVYFNLGVVELYTDIELNKTIEEFDILQENGLLGEIVSEIGSDYETLLGFLKMMS